MALNCSRNIIFTATVQDIAMKNDYADQFLYAAQRVWVMLQVLVKAVLFGVCGRVFCIRLAEHPLGGNSCGCGFESVNRVYGSCWQSRVCIYSELAKGNRGCLQRSVCILFVKIDARSWKYINAHMYQIFTLSVCCGS